ncbi:MAG: DUF1592 domain-containing protein [Thermoanaerobaculia bacterium]|nr:DUF1592 domain-containing protein [Thermoanaerobaculia bacterium]
MDGARNRCRLRRAARLGAAGVLAATAVTAQPAPDAPPPHVALVERHCLACHDSDLRTGGLDLETAAAADLRLHRETWEKVVRKLNARQMPPQGRRRPEEATYAAVVASLERELDRIAAVAPEPGRTGTFRRLNRTEYGNAVRDLLDLEVDVASLLPADSSSYGFDNITVGDLSPTLLERYVASAEKISRLAVGRTDLAPTGVTFRAKPDRTQERHLDGLPPGTRGGLAATHNFPADADYEITVRLARDRNEHVEGLNETTQLELLIDRERVHLFTIEPAEIVEEVALNYQPSQDHLDAHLHVRLPVAAGPHHVAATFLAKPWVVEETAREPYEAHFNYYRHPRVQPAVFSLAIDGPYDVRGGGDTPSRRRIVTCRPEDGDELGCAREILGRLMRLAYRRPIEAGELERLLSLYRRGREEGSFEDGIEIGLAAILVSPEFLFRIERDPPGLAPGTPYRIAATELASRLAFFLWSSLPDEELLAAAEAGDLATGAGLEAQVRRMLASPRADNLVTNFASQWLHLRNLDQITPDKRLFADFDDNLRQAFRRETELFVGSVMREDRSVLDLLHADYTFLNERLAKHYGIPHVYGSRFRRVELDDDSARGGLLRHGSILAVTSFATRTSPVVRGNWVLSNLLGVPPPPPPANVPDLPETRSIGRELPMRERLSEHRDNPACSGCHRLMDPIGFALESYDAVGRWRTIDAGAPVDTSAVLFDGTRVDGVADLETALLARRVLFLTTFTEKLLTFATGRGVEYTDAAAVRRILREAEGDGYRFSSIVLGIARSAPFQMRTTAAPAAQPVRAADARATTAEARDP